MNRLTLLLLTLLALLACTVPALAKDPTPPPPVPIPYPNYANVLTELNSIINDKSWPLQGEDRESDPVRKGLNAVNVKLALTSDEVLHDPHLSHDEKQAWLEKEFCPNFDPDAAIAEIGALAEACRRDRLRIGQGGMPMLNRFGKITDTLTDYAQCDHFNHLPCD